MKRLIIALALILVAGGLLAYGQGSSVFPYVTSLWRTFLDGTTAEFQADSDSTTFFQVLDADGGVPVLNVDTTNERVGVGNAAPTAVLDINSDLYRVRTAKTPATSSASGNQGDHAWDTNYLYVCVSANTWKRTALSTWAAGTDFLLLESGDFLLLESGDKLYLE